MKPTLRGRLKRAYKQITFLEVLTRKVRLKNPNLICNYCEGSHEADECELNHPSEQGNNKRKEKGKDGPEWTVKRDMLVQHRKGLREQYSQILSLIDRNKTPKLEAPPLAITNRSRISTQKPPFPTVPRATTNSSMEGKTKKENPKDFEKGTMPELIPHSPILYQPSRTSDPPFLSRLKKQNKYDEDERILSIFKQIQINLPFLEAMIHMPKGAKVLKDLLSNKEKLKKAATSVILSVECLAIIQKNLPQKEGDSGRFILPCLIGLLIVKNALTDLGASINLMPHSLFQQLGISELNPTKISI
nr:hypothetical protein [Tanacetum cinerariifolium]